MVEAAILFCSHIWTPTSSFLSLPLDWPPHLPGDISTFPFHKLQDFSRALSLPRARLTVETPYT
jgi:hypothetical protein